MWSLSLGHEANQTVFYEHTVDFQSLKYGGPSASLSEVEIVEVNNLGCDPMDHEAAASRIAIIQEGSQDCELWVVASNAAKAGALAVLFYNSPAHDSLLSSPLLPLDWMYGDPLISIPVLSVTHSLGLAFLGNQSSILLSIVTKNMVDEMEGRNRDNSFIGKIIAAFHFIIGTISSICHYVLDKIIVAVTWLWEYSKAVTVVVGAAILPVALNVASSLATKMVGFGGRCMRATVVAIMGMVYRLSKGSKVKMQNRENLEPTDESVESIQSRGMPAPEREPVKTTHTCETSSTHPLYSIYFVGASFIAGLIVGGCFTVAVVAATRSTPA